MAMCRECRSYVPIDGTWGDCFGTEVLGDRNACECRLQAFALKKEASQIQI